MSKKLCLLMILIISFPILAQKKLPKSLAKIDNYVASVMQEFKVPGVSLAIVQDGEAILTKGYGIRKLAEKKTVDAQTLFAIASNTKAFTATALGILIEEGKLEWDAPVINYLPWFQLSHPFVTREMTIRDLLVHRSGLGLGAGDLLWWPPTDLDRKEIVRRLRNIPLARSFRSAYAYDNVLYIVAGEVIETISGQTCEEFINSRILTPVGMKHSKTKRSAILESGNIAAPHGKVDDTLQLVKPFVNDNVGAAGAIISCAEDMAKWMIVQLDSGRLADGATLFKPATTRQLWGLVTPISIQNPPKELAPLRSNFSGYALGFGLRDYRGYKLVSHTGGLPGYLSRVAMIPELKIGVTVLTNQESSDAFNSISYYVLDQLMNAPDFNWLDAFRQLKQKADARLKAESKSTLASRDTTSKPSLPLEKYAGTYSDAWYGDIVIVLENGKLVLRFTHSPSLVGQLEHWQYDTFIVRWTDRELRADAYITFNLNPDGSIDQAKMRAVSSATDFSFDFHDLLLKPAQNK